MITNYKHSLVPSLTSVLNELKSLTVIVEFFRLFHSVDALYVIDFLSMSVL